MKKEIQQNLGFNANMVQKHSIAVIQLTSPVNDIDYLNDAEKMERMKFKV